MRMKLTEWINNQPDYGLCDPPMSDREALRFLVDYLVPGFQVAMPESQEQVNTVIVYEILETYSKTFRKEIRDQKRRKHSR